MQKPEMQSGFLTLTNPSAEELEDNINTEKIRYIINLQPHFDYTRLPVLKWFECHSWGDQFKPAHLNCTTLEYLDIASLNTNDLRFLSNARNLKALRMVKGPIKNLSGIESLKQLRELDLLYVKSLKDISLISTCLTLEVVNIENTPNIEDVSAIYGLKNLYWLCITAPKVKQRDLSWLKDMPKLQCASIYVETEKINWSIFAEHPSLYSVAFYTNHGFVAESDEEIIKKLSAAGKVVREFLRFPKDKLPAFIVHFETPTHVVDRLHLNVGSRLLIAPFA